MSDEIRAEAIDVLARALRAEDLKKYPSREDRTPREDWEYLTKWVRTMYLDAAVPFVEALDAAGLLPTIVEEVETGVWGTNRLTRRRVRYLTEWRRRVSE